MTKFSPGQSGNPNGKLKGTPNKRTQLVKLLEPHANELINKVVEMAINGDINALKLCIERLIPKIKNETIDFPLPQQDLNNTDDLLKYGTEIIEAVTNQTITPEQGKTLFDLVQAQLKNIEFYNLTRKINEIEYILKNRPTEKNND